MENTEIKIIVVKTKGLTKLVDVMEAFQRILDRPVQYHTINISPKINHVLLKETLIALYKSDITIRDGVTGGCYGARDGSTAPGFTIWVDASLLIDEYKDDEYGYQFNPDALLKAHGELVEDLDGDVFADQCVALGLKVTHDNSCNNENHFMFDFQYKCIENESDHDAAVFLCVAYHCGGDSRGNYTSSVVYKFDSMDDIYSVLLPCLPEGEE